MNGARRFLFLICRYTIMSLKRRVHLLKVFSGFRITLPYEWRNKNGIKVGDFVKCVFDDIELTLIPVEVEVREKK
jgi:bifunctional DNA-binding transcriptional regulator/antitoxin component of YhaV-PrlF toxin-antitoxin module